MNILILSTHLNVGGITSYIWKTTRKFIQRGHRVYIISGGGNMVKEVAALGAEHFTFNIRTKSELNPKLSFAMPKLCRFVKEKNIDIIHAQTRVTQVVGFFLGKFTKRPFVSTCHGFYKLRFLRKLFPFWGDGVIAISQAVYDHLLFDFKTDKEKIALIRHGIDPTRFPLIEEGIRKKMREEFGIKNETPVIGIIARLADIKGHGVLLKAMKKVVEEIPEAILLIIGEGRMEKQLKKMTADLDLGRNVFFYSAINHTRNTEIFSLLDIFAMPSLKEGLGLSLMEAQAVGLPVVGSRIGGIPDLIKDNQTGFLVSPGDSEDLSRALLQLLKDKKRAHEIGLAARKFIIEQFSIEEMIDKTLRFYQNAVDRKKKDV